ncbi:hypothetical protein [Xanthomarina gelatinilytica]|uniref:hypothetical protein n=1 Tax=Xanthomarina gelatinilytica TaxID=1137281 RepID=UPI003AA86508
MDNSKMLDRLNEMEAHLQILQQSVTALKQELEDGGASKSSARKGALSSTQKADLLAQRQKRRLK